MKTCCLFAPAVVIALLAASDGPLTPPEDRIIHYNGSEDLADPVAVLQKRIASGQAKLVFETEHGYLISLLNLLRVPVSSQCLVFSKTSLQSDLVSPKTPRAIYFSDTVYVSWVPGGDSIDITAMDPAKGPIFYSLSQRSPSPPRFTRGDQCFQCHMGPKTLNVPGPLINSAVTSPDGRPLFEVDGFIMGHGSPFRYRWAGWYVTAAQGSLIHMGNSFAPDPNHPDRMDLTGSLRSLQGRIDASRYLSPGSDIVALLILAHQMKMHDLLTRAGYETRYALDEQKSEAASELTRTRIARVAEPLLEYMLFRDEVPLDGPVTGSSSFAVDFARGGRHDSQGRSLRQLDLHTRLMRYPCSYLIYSDAFEGLPRELKSYLWRRLFAILSGQDRGAPWATISEADRRSVLEILRETKPEFAALVQAEQSVGFHR